MRPQTQLNRCFIQAIEEPETHVKRKRRGNPRRTWRDEIPMEMTELLRPWVHPYLVFDTETLTDARSGQQAKIIFWQERGPKGSPEYDRLDAMQLALKLIANATSYGVLVEVIVDEHKAETPCWVYHGGKNTLRKAQKKTINAEVEWDEGFK